MEPGFSCIIRHGNIGPMFFDARIEPAWGKQMTNTAFSDFYLHQGGCVFAFVCLSVCRITQKVIDEF